MKDEQGYLDRMQVGMYDKCWWLANIDSDVDTIIDFGCADGSLFRFVESMYPGRFNYVGIDNEPHFLERCPSISGRTSYFKYFFEIEGVDWDKSILVMNSVCHEIYSYVSKFEVGNILTDAQMKGIRHIAIRDMYFHSKQGVSIEDWLKIDDALIEKYPTQYFDNNMFGRDWRELIMKYTYTDNWEREKMEAYFHPTFLFDVDASLRDNYTKEVQYFRIPQQIKRIERDLGLTLPEFTTHVKIWITKED